MSTMAGSGQSGDSSDRSTDRSLHAELRSLHEDEWRWRLDQFADVTGLDILIEPGRQLYDHLPNAGYDAQLERLDRWEAVDHALSLMDVKRFSAPQRLNHRIYRAQIGSLIDAQRWADYEMPVNSDSAFWSEVAGIGRRSFVNKDDHQCWLAQMRDIPRYFAEMIELMRGGLQRGFTPPRLTMNGRDGSISAITGAQPEDTSYYLPFRRVSGSRAIGNLAEEAVRVIADHVQPAHAKLLAFMQDEYLPGCRETLAARDLPDGEAWYQAKVRHHTTLDLSPRDIHEFGLSEVARLRREMAEIVKEVGFNGSLINFIEHLRTDPQFYAKTTDELLMRAAWVAKKFDGVAGTYFGLLPRMRFAIKPVPDEIAPYYTAGRGAPGLYSLNTYELGSRPLFNLPALTLHESAPGHAFQFSLAIENADLPAFRRQTYLPAYAEGWALYCEQLGLEMGFYETPYERFGMLGYQIWRASRLVVDTGIHAFGWHRDRARAYLSDNTSLSAHEVGAEVDRYISWPAQALSYYLGEDAIWKARRYAEGSLGQAFDLRKFHDTILALGSVPLTVLRSAIEQLVATPSSEASAL